MMAGGGRAGSLFFMGLSAGMVAGCGHWRSLVAWCPKWALDRVLDEECWI